MLFALLFRCNPALAQWGEQVERVSESLIWGPFHDVEAAGDYCFCATGYGLAVFDVSLPADLQLVSLYGVPGTTEGVYVSGSRIYLASGTAGIQILDISDPTTPTFLGEYDTPGYAYEAVCDGAYLYVADGSNGLRILNISDPAQPRPVSSVNLGGWARDLQKDGDYLYIAAEASGLKIVNVADPSQPQVIGQYNTSGLALGVRKEGNLVYLCDGPGGVLILNVADPTQPSLLGQWTTIGAAHKLKISGAYAFVANDAPGLAVLNVNNPQLPYLVGQYNSPGLAWSLDISGTTLFLADHQHGLLSVLISNPQAPSVMDSFTFPGEALSVWVSGIYAYVARGYGQSVTILDVHDPVEPIPVTSYSPPHPSDVVDIMIQENVSYTCHLQEGVYFFDVSDPQHPVYTGRGNTVGESVDLVPRLPIIYVADSWEGLVFMIPSPFLAWQVPTTDWAKGITLVRDTAYVCEWSAGVALVNVAVPTQPELLVEYDTPGLARRCVVQGNYIYVADDAAGLTILSLTGGVVGNYNTAGLTHDVEISGSRAYLADDVGGLIVLDIANPASPQVLGTYRTPGPAQDVYLHGEDIYVACQYCLGIYRYSGTGVLEPPPAALPDEIELSAAPNPFNSSLKISLQVRKPQSFRLSVYNLKGQEITRLFGGRLDPGEYDFQWDADAFASGIFLIQARGADVNLIRKVVLLK
jgi:hypothetical protein